MRAGIVPPSMVFWLSRAPVIGVSLTGRGLAGRMPRPPLPIAALGDTKRPNKQPSAHYLMRQVKRQPLTVAQALHRSFVGANSWEESATGVGFTKPEKVDLSQYPAPTRLLSKDDCVVQFVRSGGAGGQNVNKVNTKADLRFDFMSASFLPDWVKEQIMEKESNRINNEGFVVVNSSKHRTQKQNYEDAVEKMQAIIDKHSKPPTGPSDKTLKKMENLARKENQKRLELKKKHSEKKGSRRDKGKWD